MKWASVCCYFFVLGEDSIGNGVEEGNLFGQIKIFTLKMKIYLFVLIINMCMTLSMILRAHYLAIKHDIESTIFSY